MGEDGEMERKGRGEERRSRGGEMMGKDERMERIGEAEEGKGRGEGEKKGVSGEEISCKMKRKYMTKARCSTSIIEAAPWPTPRHSSFYHLHHHHSEEQDCSFPPTAAGAHAY